MPQIKFSGLVTAMKGKAGGSIFSQNKQGAYFRNNRWGGGRKSQRWDAAKVKLAALSNSWRLLTSEQREAWQAAGADYPMLNKFKDEYIPSGYQLYMSLNGNLYAQNQPLLEVPGPNTPFPETADIVVTTSSQPWVTGGTGATFPNISAFNLGACNDDEECAYGYMCIDNVCTAVSVPGSPEYNKQRQDMREQFRAFAEPECTSDADCVDAGLSGGSADVACQDGVCVYVGDGLVYWESTAYVLNIEQALVDSGVWNHTYNAASTQVNGSFRFALGPNTLNQLRTTQNEIVLVSNYNNDGRGISIRIRPQDQNSTRVYITFGLGTGEVSPDAAMFTWYQDFSNTEFVDSCVLQFRINPGDTVNSFICLNSSGFLYGIFEYWEGLKTGPISTWGSSEGTGHDPYAEWETLSQWQGVVYGAGLMQASTDVIYSDIRFFPRAYSEFKYPLSGMLEGTESILITASGIAKPNCSYKSCSQSTDACGDNRNKCNCAAGICGPWRDTAERFANQAPGGISDIRLVAAVPVMNINEPDPGVYTYDFAGYWLNLMGGLFANNKATYVPLVTASITAIEESGYYWIAKVTRAKGAGKSNRSTEYINMALFPADMTLDWELWDYIKPAITSAPPGSEFYITFELLNTNNGNKKKPRTPPPRFKAGADLSSSVN